MCRRKYVLAVLLLMMLIAQSLVGVIYCLSTVEVSNYFETGVVNIRLSEYQLHNGSLLSWKNDAVLPGDTISRIPTVQNLGVECYVRIKISVGGISSISEENLVGVNPELIKADDGYLYYPKVLSFGESIEVFQGIFIPTDLSQEWEKSTFHVDVDVDAIQSKNFTPDFNLAKPWGSVDIIRYSGTEDYDVNKLKVSDSKSFKIEYMGSVKELIKNEDDFFTNFPYLMPGDWYSDSIILENNSSNDIKLYFRSENLDSSVLPDKILLTIYTVSDGNKTIFYSGHLSAPELSKNSLLCVIEKNACDGVIFEVSVPAELNNQYTLLDSKVKWVFSTEPIEDTDVPKTYDSVSLLWASVAMFASSLWCLFLLVYYKRSKDRLDAV